MPNSHHPLTDIIVLTHNNLPVTKKFFYHLYENTVDFNLIVVDNNSSDGTVQFLRDAKKSNKNIMLIENPENYGVATGRNIGLKTGNAEYCFCMDNDQFPITPNWLNELFMIVNKGYDIAGVDAWIQNSPQHRTKPYFPTKHCQTIFDRPTYVGGGGCLIPRKIFEEIDFFDDFYSPFFFEDSDAFFKMSKKGYRGIWHPNAKVHHLGHNTRNSQRNFNMITQFQKNYKYFVKKWTPYFPRPMNVLILEKMLPEILKPFRRKPI